MFLDSTGWRHFFHLYIEIYLSEKPLHFTENKNITKSGMEPSCLHSALVRLRHITNGNKSNKYRYEPDLNPQHKSLQNGVLTAAPLEHHLKWCGKEVIYKH